MGSTNSEARWVAEQLRGAGHRALFAGGCVRDLLLGREPKDFDVATDATPDAVTALFRRADLVGAHFGVVLVRTPFSDAAVEVATFRTDHAYLDGRHPAGVTFESDPRQDAQRRDFTINGMFLDPATDEVLDFVGGRADLEHRVIRAIGDPARRFEEDHLRLLRAVRFAARLDFTIEPATHAAISALKSTIHRVAAERIRDELNRILTEGHAKRGFELLDETGLLGELLPEVERMKGVEQPPQFHPEGDVWVHTLLLLDGLKPPPVPVTLAWGALLHDVGKPPTFRVADRIRFDGHVEAGVEIGKRILSRLRFSKDDSDQILALIQNHMRFGAAGHMKDSTFKRFIRMERFDEHLELHRLDCAASSSNLDTWRFVARKRAETPPESIRPPRLVSGADLIAAGYQPGSQFREILNAVEDAQLEGRLTSREAALAWVAEIYPLR